MSYIYFGLRISQKKSIEYRKFSYTVRLCLDQPDMERMGWKAGDRLIIDRVTGTIRKAEGWDYGPAITLGACHSGRAHFQSVEPWRFHVQEQRRHCRRAICDSEKGIVMPGDVDDTLNKTTFEKREVQKMKNRGRQTIWKPSKRLAEAYEMNRANRGLRILGRDFRNKASLRSTPKIEEGDDEK